MSERWIGAPWVWQEGEWRANRWLLLKGERLEAIVSPEEEGAPKMGAVGEGRQWFKQGALLPALIDGHTHLELGALRGRLPEQVPMTQWAGALRRELESWGDEGEAIRKEGAIRGAQELVADGVGTILDLGNSTVVPQLAKAGRLGGVRLLFRHELLGWSHPQSQLQSAKQLLLKRAPYQHHLGGPPAEDGLTVHAPHSTHPDTIRQIAGDAALHRGLLTIHTGEGAEEQEFISTGGGGWKKWYNKQQLQVDLAGTYRDGWHYLTQFLPSAAQTVLVHANYIGEASLREIAQTATSLVHCPLSHHFFGHPTPPFHLWDRLKIPVALGSDSLASSPTLSLWENMRHLFRTSGLSQTTILQWATEGGARAIGLEKVGALLPGFSADLQLLEWREPTPPQLLSNRSELLATWIAGVLRYRHPLFDREHLF